MYKLQSIKYGRWSLLQVISCFLAFTLFFIHCSPESFSGGETQEEYNLLVQMEESEIDLYQVLEIFRTLDNVKEFESSEDILEYMLGTNTYEQTSSVRQDLSTEIEEYKSVGFDSYVANAQTIGLFSVNIKNWLMTYQDNLRDFLDTSPNAEEANSYFSNIDNFMYSNSYSTNELQLIKVTANALKDMAKYYYIHFADSNLDFNDAFPIDLRDSDCNFLEGLLCTLLWVGIMVAIFYAVYTGIVGAATGATIPYEVTKGGVLVGTGTATVHSVAAATGLTANLIPFLLITNYWKEYYEWCCGKKEEKVCSPPIGSLIKELDCNEFEISFYGAGDYKTTTWQNINAIPASVVTPTPILSFTVPSPSEPSQLKIIPTTCLELPSGNIKIYTDDAEGIMNQFGISWQVTPPSTIVLSNLENPENPDLFFANVKPSELLSGFNNSTSYTYDWSITGDHEIMPQGPKAHIELNINDLGIFTIEVVVTDVCTEETQSLSKNINLIQ